MYKIIDVFKNETVYNCATQEQVLRWLDNTINALKSSLELEEHKKWVDNPTAMNPLAGHDCGWFVREKDRRCMTRTLIRFDNYGWDRTHWIVARYVASRV